MSQTTNIMAYYAQLHKSLKTAEDEMEKAIEAHSDASERYSEAIANYERSLGEEISKSEHPVTIREKIARGKCANLKEVVEHTEGLKNTCKMYVNLWEHRINNYKFTGRKIDEIMSSRSS